MPYYVMPRLPPIIMLAGLTVLCIHMNSMCEEWENSVALDGETKRTLCQHNSPVPSKGNVWIFYAGYILANILELYVLSVECSIKLVARMRQMAARMARLLTDNKDPHGIASCLGVSTQPKKIPG